MNVYFRIAAKHNNFIYKRWPTITIQMMMLIAYAQVGPPATVQVWVGLFGTANPPQLTMDAGGEGQLTVLSPLRSIRDSITDAAGQALNHRAILQLTGLQPGTSYLVTVRAGAETRSITTSTLPAALPQKLDDTFNILLCSCYSQPEDASGLMGSVVSQIMLRPHMTMMLGDQIYGDLPIFEDLPAAAAGVAQKLGEKYLRNWASTQLETGGLGRVFSRAPVVCVADDHEFWNNYPFAQTQLPKTWTAPGRAQWKAAAQGLYEDYQLAGAAGGAQRIDIDPLKMLVVDMRSLRDEKFTNLMPPATVAEIVKWEADLLADRAVNKPAFGLLASGQALFVTPTQESKRERQDAEMSNYAQFGTLLVPTLERLSAAGIPVIYVTGDVHWSRVAQARDVRSERLMVYEVIASPSRLIRIPALDAAKEALADLKGIFGKAKKPWPRHGDAEKVPKRLGESGRFRLECDLETKWGFSRQGDHVAVMSFCKAGAGIDFNVTYYAVTDDKALGKSETTRTYELRNI